MATAIVKANIFVERLMDRLNDETTPFPQINRMVLGNGGKDGLGSLKHFTGAETDLFNRLKDISITKNKTQLNQTVYSGTIDPRPGGGDTDLLGEDINEIGLIDSAGNIVCYQTIEGFGPIQDTTTYTYEIPFTIL